MCCDKFPYTRVLASTRCCWWWCADQNSVKRLWKHHHLSRCVPTPPESLFKLLRHRFTHLINWLKFCEILPAARGQCPNVPILCQYSHFAGSKTYLHALKIDAWPSESLQFESIEMYAIISSINWKWNKTNLFSNVFGNKII